MLNKCCFLICCLCFTAVLTAEENFTQVSLTSIQDNSAALLEVSHRYMDFINRIGKGETFAQMDEATTLFAPSCKKVFNGWLVAENREDLVTDLLAVYENHGSWKSIPIDIISAAADNTLILRIIIETERFGTNTAIVILRCDSDYLITEINEVFSQVHHQYNFKDTP
jgi:hypothetical protein